MGQQSQRWQWEWLYHKRQSEAVAVTAAEAVVLVVEMEAAVVWVLARQVEYRARWVRRCVVVEVRMVEGMGVARCHRGPSSQKKSTAPQGAPCLPTTTRR